jgi:uncharacterized protein (TIGR03435 family)
MLRTLLQARFQLRLRIEKREMSTYDLTVAKGGPKLPAANPAACVDPDTPAARQPGAAPLPKCGTGWLKGDRSGSEVGGFGLSMTDFARALTNAVGRTVIDKTGLSQRFDVRVEFASREGLSMGKPGAPAGPPPDDPGGNTLFSALQQQLGLKLEPAKDPVEFLVIERAERPSAN